LATSQYKLSADSTVYLCHLPFAARVEKALLRRNGNVLSNQAVGPCTVSIFLSLIAYAFIFGWFLPVNISRAPVTSSLLRLKHSFVLVLLIIYENFQNSRIFYFIYLFSLYSSLCVHFNSCMVNICCRTIDRKCNSRMCNRNVLIVTVYLRGINEYLDCYNPFRTNVYESHEEVTYQ
jgi:hypothetical protein